MAAIDVDVSTPIGTNVGPDVRAWREAWRGLAFELVEEHGPAGGWPVYRVTGPLVLLVTWLVYGYADGDEDVAVALLRGGLTGDAAVRAAAERLNREWAPADRG